MKRLAALLAVLLATACGGSKTASSPHDAGGADADAGSAHDATADQITDSAPEADTSGTVDALADQAADSAPEAGDAMADQTAEAAPEAGDASTSAAAGSCGAAPAAPTSITYTGSTCTDGSDGLTFSCNSGAHPEVVVRVDGTQGQVWSITPSAGLAFAMYLGTPCSGAPLSCASGSVDGGGGITDGPFPATRTDYFVFETMAPQTCGPYTVTVALQ